jgi:hypothetical protein
MPRFRLTAPHWLERSGVAQLVEANVEIDTSELPAHFQPSPHAMIGLDPDARAMLFEVAARVRHYNQRKPNISGIGHITDLPGGAAYKEPNSW